MIVPNAFTKDPKGYMFNQFGHAALGVALVYLVSVLGAELMSELPNKEIIAVVVLGFYFVVIELALQGWRRADTIEDTAFVAYGALAALATFTERGAGVVCGQIDGGFGFFCLGAFHLAGGMLLRALGKRASKA